MQAKTYNIYGWYVSFVLLIGFTFSFIDRQVLNLLVVPIQNDLIITDDDKPIALAGVMGGYDTEVTNSTKNLLIESAYFDKVSIMKTSRRLNLISDASINILSCSLLLFLDIL